MSRLEKLPDRMVALESQIVLLRTEMRDEFSAIRREMKNEIGSGDEETRRVLRDEIRAGDEETRTLMRVLHEDLIGRIAVIGEGRQARRKQPKE